MTYASRVKYAAPSPIFNLAERVLPVIGNIATRLALEHGLLQLCEVGSDITIFCLQIQNSSVREKLTMEGITKRILDHMENGCAVRSFNILQSTFPPTMQRAKFIRVQNINQDATHI